jgi:hypothetical protein
MSDNFIRLVPDDPNFVPNAAQQLRAKAWFAEIAPGAAVEATVCDTIQFFDCGANCERIRCPACKKEVAVDWWQDHMEEDFVQGFRLSMYVLPCCAAKCNLNQLVYEGSQAFGRFVLDAMNPDIGILTDERKKELEDLLGTKLRVIYRHI